MKTMIKILAAGAFILGTLQIQAQDHLERYPIDFKAQSPSERATDIAARLDKDVNLEDKQEHKIYRIKHREFKKMDRLQTRIERKIDKAHDKLGNTLTEQQVARLSENRQNNLIVYNKDNRLHNRSHGKHERLNKTQRESRKK